MYFDVGRVARWLCSVLLMGLCIGCGFQPLMGRSDAPAVQENLAQIRVDMIPDRSGQILRNYLLDGLVPKGVEGQPRYRLQVVLEEPRREVAIQRDNTASRVAYAATTRFYLRDSRTSSVVFSGTSYSETTYEVTTSEYATLSSLNGARERVLQDVSADIRQQLAEFLGRPVR